MARFPGLGGLVRATSVTVGGVRIPMPVWGDPRLHTNWLNHPLYEPVLSLLDGEKAHGCGGWEVVLRGSGTDQPWLASKWPWGPMLRGLGPHELSPARPWLIVPPPGHDKRVWVEAKLQAGVDRILAGDERRPRGRLAGRAPIVLEGVDEGSFDGLG